MPSRRHALAVVLGVVVAVVAVAIGAAALGGLRSTPAGASAAGQPGQNPQSDQGAVPAASSGFAAAEGSLVAALPVIPDAARAPELADRAGTIVATGDRVIVESVPLSAPATIEVDGVAKTVSSVYRVTVSAGPYQVRDAAAVLSVDGAPLGVAQESVDLSSLVLMTFDDAVVTDGATIAHTYGLPDAAPTEWSAVLEVVS